MSHIRLQRRLSHSGIASKRALLPVWIICSFMFALILAVFVKQYLDERPQHSDVTVRFLDPVQDLTISPTALSRGSIHLYSIKSSGQELRFLVQKTNENVIRVAAATCRSCKGSSQLHYAHDGVFYCGKCRQAMHVETGQPSSRGGCSMPEIPSSEPNGMLLVRASDVRAAYEKAFR
jgi:hypothetical protein